MDENPYAAPRAAASPPVEELGFVVSIPCSDCPGQIRLGEERCSGCGRAVTPDESRALRERWAASDSQAAKWVEESYWGRVAMGGAAAIATLQALLALESTPALTWGILGAVVLWGLFAWSFRDGRLAAGVAIGAYLVWWFAPLVFAPLWLLDGGILKIITLIALVTGFGAESAMARRRSRARPAG
jgi:hypothetical protein